MLRLALVVMIGAALLAATLAAAASLNVTAGVLQAGADTDLVCDADSAVNAKFGTSFNNGQRSLEVVNVTISGIDVACAGQQVTVYLETSNSAVIYGPATLPAQGFTGTFTVGTTQPFALRPDQVIGVHVQISTP